MTVAVQVLNDPIPTVVGEQETVVAVVPAVTVSVPVVTGELGLLLESPL